MESFKWGKNKENTKKNISWLLVMVFAFSLVTARIIITKADDNNELRILEIQPGNSFTIIGDNNSKTTTESESDTRDVTSTGGQKYKAIIEHVSMPEFIGKIDQLNGKYDVIVIGRNTTNITNPYRDYSAINNNGTEYMGQIIAGKNDLSPNGNYAENDITKRKAEEIKTFIDSGQLVYINKTILNDSLLQKSNLQSFKSITPKDNFITDKNDTDFSLENILNKYLEKDSNSQGDIINKRPKITVENTSYGDTQTDYSKTVETDYVGTSRNRNMRFSVNIPQSIDNFTVKLFLDINGDGVFTDKECYKKEMNVPSQPTYNLSYDIGTQFIGWLDWKVEVEKPNGVKSYETGNIFFKKLNIDDIRQVRVLQVSPNVGLDLQNDKTFTDILKNFNDRKDYNLNITKITSDEFNGRAGKTIENLSSIWKSKGPLELNGTYDMVIIGFSDSYAQKDITGDALDELQKFIKSGQSVMFTHDTMSFRMDESTTKKSSIELTKRFRDFVGQSRFIDKYRTDGKQTDAYQQYNPEGKTYTERIIPHSDLVDQNGTILTANKSIVGYALNGRKNITHTTKVYKTNTGLINNYPYTLGDIAVAKTHNQWYQLNLEDPDVVPWYNLKYDNNTNDTEDIVKDGSNLNQYDSRNNYYTYSKGSITYSGTGHSDGYTEEEFKLFINTMIKAERGANHAPEIVCSIPSETTDSENEITNEVVAGGTHSFTVDADDLEREIVDMHITIDGTEITSDNINKVLKDRGGEDSNTKEDKVFSINTADIDRENVEIVIPDSKLQNINDKVVIKIDATDIQGAKREKSYILKAVEAPQFNVTAALTGITKVNDNDKPIDSQVSGNSINVKKDDVVKVSYKVNPGQLTYGNADDYLAKDVAIIVDKSINNEVMTSVADGIDNSMFSNDNFVNKKNGNVQFDLITYGSGTVATHTDDIINSETKDINGVNINYQSELHNRLLNISKESLDANDLGSAIKVTQNDFLKNYGRENSSKTIIIISCGNPTGDIGDLMSIAKENNYNIITLAISNDFKVENPYEQLLNWHYELGGLPGDYYISKPDSDGQTSHNNINNDIMPKIAESLSLMKYKTYSIKDVNLNFNLGDEIDLVGNGLRKQDVQNIDSKEYMKNIPDIKYMATKQSDGSLVYKGYFLDDQIDNTNQEYNLEFKITTNATAKADCPFGQPNKITYKSVINQIRENVIQTPILLLDTATINHGVYKGISSRKADIDATGTLGFAKGSVVTFASNITGMNNSTNLKVTIDHKAQISEKPKVYMVNVDGNLELLRSDFELLNDDITFELKNFNGLVYHDIVVLYSIKLDESQNGLYTNGVRADWDSTSATVNSKDKELPDLF